MPIAELGSVRFRAIGEFDAPSVEPAVMRVAQADVDAEVREAASAVLAKRVAR